VTRALAALAAALADRYRVERELGRGGMATVYLARDLKHDRPVALKVLKPDLAAAIGPDRFLREIQVTGQLHHPHILPLYDSGQGAEFLYYVMPYVEGESLRNRLAREKQLPLDDALQIAREVADALSYAHSRGVVHRDIKPENILLESGHAVVADFGIARAISAAGGDRLTETGLAVGTPSYMSPEQAAGSQDLDGRSDLYSLGCVLYEMLAGQPPFTGPTVEAVLRQHLTVEPPNITGVRPAVPAAVAAALERALAKTPADRFNPVALFAEAIAPSGWRAGAGPQAARPAPWGRRLTILAVAVVAILVVALSGILGTRREASFTVVRTTRVQTDQEAALDPALSPDGRFLAYAGGDRAGGQTTIYVRQLDGGGTVALTAGHPDAPHRWPRWSPDGARIAYEGSRGIYVVPALGGEPQHVASGRFPAWSPDAARLAFTRADTLFVLALDASTPEVVAAASNPHSLAWSPDGRRIAFVIGNPGYVGRNFVPSAVGVVDLASRAVRGVTDTLHLNQSPVWSADGRGLFFVSDRDGSRDAYFLSLDRSAGPRGTPLRLTVGADVHLLSPTLPNGALAYSVLRLGYDVWEFSLQDGARQTSLADGRRLTSGGAAEDYVDISPDGEWLMFGRLDDASNRFGIYKRRVGGGDLVRVTGGDPGDAFVPEWSPDGREIAFYRFVDGSRDVFVMSADGRNERRLTRTPGQESAPDWSPDGRTLVFLRENRSIETLSRPDVGSSAWETKPRQIVVNGGWPPRWSPDGRLIAFFRAVGSRVPGGTGTLVEAPPR
jgi:eukaryotic-like serine/threonine-protein kinase